jgi:PAP2 superfamily
MKRKITSSGRTIKTLVLLYCLLASLFGSAAARADAVLDWNAIAVNTAVANKQNPFAQARYAAIVQLAVFEAVNSITHKYQLYLGTIAAPADSSPDAAAIEASYQVLSTYFPASQTTLYAAWTNSMQAIPDGQAKTDGIATGDAAAAAMIALRANDGSSPAKFYTPGLPVPGAWQATPSCPVVNGVAVGIAFQWQNIVPFGIRSASDFLLDPPPPLTSEEYAKAYNEVMTVGSINSTQRPPDRANVALYYAASSPTQVFNQVAEEIAVAQRRTLSENARALALINMAISDSLVASFLNKYDYTFWRPETAIHASGNTNWTPFITTPCFPSYPSNHGSAANAAAEVMRHLYGEAGHPITLTNPAVPTITLRYTSFKQITDDIADARVYGGIHYRFDQRAGARLGHAVGREVYRNNLRWTHDHE